MNFKETQAIYLQIVDYVCEQILLEQWKEQERIPSVRELAVRLQVNPNTVMRAYDYLQNSEVIFNKRGVGFFASEKARKKIIVLRKKTFLEQELPIVFKNIDLLEMTWEELGKEYNKYRQNTYRNKQ